jgi:Fe-S oxidoreductase/nitrate reductase gamma subunit
MEPFREVFWNIPDHVIFYSLAAVATGVFLYGLYRRYRLWTAGWPEKRGRSFDWKLVAGRVFANASIFRGDPVGGVTHILIMWGFIVLFLGTVMSTIDHWLVSYLTGDLYLAYAFVLDIAGVALMAGVALAYLRRYVLKSGKMVTVIRDHVVLILIFFVSLTGFMVEGLRLRAAPPLWSEPSPVGQWIASVSALDVPGALLAHRIWWWIHSIASLSLIAWFPFSKFIHVFAAPVNLVYEGMESSAFLTLEEREALGSDFSARQRIMMDACTQCNRCTVVCPSAAAGEPLSPRAAVDEAGSFVRRAGGFGLFPKRPPAEPPKRGTAVGPEAAWLCTTCGHCRIECPSAISPMDIIREVRTARVESGENVPDNLQEMLESVYKFKNPWQGAKGKRMDWAAGLDIPVFADGAKETRCFYVGCTFAYDERLQEVPRSAAAIFAAAGYRYGVLGKEEVCCSEFVRGAGEDGLFFELAGQNIDAFERHGVEEIVTPCPHGMHTFANEYRRMAPGAAARRVLHVSQALEEILRGGALGLEDRGERAVTYHDPCFLGRRSGVYDAPRNVLRSIPGVRLIEMKRSRERSLCCGGGGGRMWVEASAGEKMGEVRAREAAETGADIIVTACPFCFTNIDDGVKTAGHEGRVIVKDLVELVAECLPGRDGA